MVRVWYIEGISFADAPSSIAELAQRYRPREVSPAALEAEAKWEPMLKGLSHDTLPGWVTLEELAQTKRGTATGANEFFLISAKRAKELGIRPDHLVPCVGRAKDVAGAVFNSSDFEVLETEGRNTRLVDFKSELSASERRYVEYGEEKQYHLRYLTKVRKPWYSMEAGRPAPIWAAVFGRDHLKFVHNEAHVRSLTNFHQIWPRFGDEVFAKAMVFCLNSPIIRSSAALQIRHYGGGLRKFEPNDLKPIAMPDLRRTSEQTLHRLASALERLDAAFRADAELNADEHDQLVRAAGEEAAKHS